jgi:DNA-damage-inducible protein J
MNCLFVCITIAFAIQSITNGLAGEQMKTEMISTRIDHETKTAFIHICDKIGLSPSQAIKLFAKAVINSGGIPFEVKIKQPNLNTMVATQELEQGGGHAATDIKQN